MAAPRLLLGLLIALPAVVLAGCISPDLIDDAGAALDMGATDLPVTAAVLHRPGANADALLDDVLPDGVPLPAGALRYSGGRSFEPTLGVTSDGSIFLSTFERVLGDSNFLRRTRDQGATWDDVTPRIGAVSMPPQSNDPYVHVDPDTDRIFLSDLQALVCSTLSFSDDFGDSWVSNPVGCGHPVGVQDHQTVFTAAPRLVTTVGYPNVVYYCINRVVDSACATSLNGGISFGPLRPVVYTGVEPCNGFIAGGLHAHGAASPDGTVYIPKAHCGYPTVAISEDDGLTWDTVVISPEIKARGHEVAFTVDEAGNAYAFWIGTDRLPYFAASADGGRTWNAPLMVVAPGVKTTDFPTITAGAEGRVAFAYVGTETDGDYDAKDADSTWNAYIGVITDALAADPVIATVTANDPADPVARGVCGGTRCGGIGDFIDIVIDAEGRPWAAFVDVCTGECAAEGGSANSGAAGFVGTLATGPTLRGELGALVELAVSLGGGE